jgi:hypothetical protein
VAAGDAEKHAQVALLSPLNGDVFQPPRKGMFAGALDAYL